MCYYYHIDLIFGILIPICTRYNFISEAFLKSSHKNVRILYLGCFATNLLTIWFGLMQYFTYWVLTHYTCKCLFVNVFGFAFMDVVILVLLYPVSYALSYSLFLHSDVIFIIETLMQEKIVIKIMLSVQNCTHTNFMDIGIGIWKIN